MQEYQRDMLHDVRLRRMLKWIHIGIRQSLEDVDGWMDGWMDG